MQTRIHADEFVDSKGAHTAAAMGCHSADHLMAITDEGLTLTCFVFKSVCLYFSPFMHFMHTFRPSVSYAFPLLTGLYKLSM